MLMNSIKEMYREMTGQITQAEPIVSVPGRLPAANASHFETSDKQARRQRRRRRMDRAGHSGITGWAVRTW